MLSRIAHQYLRVPFTLNIHYVTKPSKPVATVLFLHGIGNSGDAWTKVINHLPDNVRIISIDLLGFGGSPKPTWAMYNAKNQARAVLATYLKLGRVSPVIIIGHSLGSLVAIELAKRYPIMVKRLILCSPPLYRTNLVASSRYYISSDDVLKQLYQSASNRPDDFVRLSAVAAKYNLINESFNVTTDNVASYMATLKTMIINQTSLEDVTKLTMPITIIRGTFDPLVVSKNINTLAKSHQNINSVTVLAGHEVRGNYVKAVVKEIKQHLPIASKTDIKEL